MATTPFDLASDPNFWTGPYQINGTNGGGSNNGGGVAPFVSGIIDLIRSRGDTAGSQALVDYAHNTPASGASNQAGVNSALSSLMGLLQNPGSIVNNPVYQAGLGFGTEAVNRGQGALGNTLSGNRSLALEKYGQDYGMGFENQIFNQLLGGVNANLGVGQLGLATQGQGFNQLNNAEQLAYLERLRQSQSIGSGIGGIASGIGGVASIIQRLISGGGNGLNGGGAGGGIINPDGSINWGAFTGAGDQGGFPGDITGGFDPTAGFNPNLGDAVQLDPGADWTALFGGLGGG